MGQRERKTRVEQNRKTKINDKVKAFNRTDSLT